MKHIRKFSGLLFTIITLFSYSVDAQILEGKVLDDTGEPVLFATIFIEETKEGCTTNDNGIFSMPLLAGNYTIRIQHISYQTDIRQITIPLHAPLVIRLNMKSITLREAVVSAKGEDPAYAIMRRAIAKAPYHRKQFESYHVDNYSKATLFIDHIPKSIKRLAGIGGEDFPFKTGDVYTLESISKISYEKDSLFHRIISVKTSFPKGIEGLETLDEFELYDIYGQTGSFVSPLSPQALSAYRFRMDSYTPDDYGQLVYHIRVIPKNNNPFAFSGYIDIVDSTWHVHYYDLSATTKMNVVSLRFNIKQNFGEVEKNIWAPISYYLSMNFEAMGIKFRTNLSASRQYTDYKLNKRNYVIFENNKTTTEPMPTGLVISEKSKRLEDKMMQIYQKDEISNREALKIISLLEEKAKEDAKNNPIETIKTLEIRGNQKITIDSMAYLRDSDYWNENRKMLLSEAEQESYEKKRIADSLSENKIQKEGNIRSFQTRNLRFGFDSFPEMISFNAVDGCKLRFGGYIEKKMKDSTVWYNTLMAGYSFNLGHAIFGLSSRYIYYPEKRASFTVFGGQESSDFNITNGTHSFVNTISSLFFKESYINLYQRSHCGIRHSIEVFNGFEARIGGLYEWRKQLRNTTEYSFFYRQSREYRPNEPDNPYLNDNEQYLSDCQAAIFNIGFSYTPQRYYYYDGRYKRAARSNFPTFSFLWEKGVPGVFNSETDYDFLSLSMGQEIRLGILKKIRYNLQGGWYPRTESMHFSEFRHFYIYEFPLIFKDFYRMYHTVKTYSPSTNEWAITGFIKYETPYLLLKFLPGLNKTLMTENLYFSYLNTPVTKNYMEIGYSLNNIWMIGHIGVFTGFEQFKYANWSLKLSINIPRL